MIYINIMSSRKKNALTVVFTIRAFRIISRVLVLPYAAASENCTLAAVTPPVLTACTFTVLEPSWSAVIVAKSPDPVFVMLDTVMNAVVPLCTTTAFIAAYSVFAASVN